MNVESAIAALEALLEEALEQLATVMANGWLRVRMDDKRVRNLDPTRHLLFNPKRPSAADRRPSMLLMDARARAPARRAIGNTLSTGKAVS